MRRIKNCIPLFLAVLILSCSTGRRVAYDIIPTEAEMREQDIQGLEQWGHLLLSVLDEEKDAENVCVSPLSAQMALSMAAAGATGTTQEEIYHVMRLTGDANTTNRSILETMNEDDRCEVKLANSIWINEKLDVKKGFIDTGKEYYNALVTTAPFNKATLERINGWCSDNTGGKIRSILNEIKKNDMMYLINALYFKGAWKDKFSNSFTCNRPFTTEAGKSVEVEIMHQIVRTIYYEDEQLQMASMPFNGGYKMILALPREESSIEDAILHLALNYRACLTNMSIYNVELYLPKFRSEFSTSLKEPLRRMGIEKAFGSEAEFSAISESPLNIDNVIQKTYISVDEDGAEAAAATAISMSLLSSGRQLETRTMEINRPFIYLITDATGENVLFAGKVGNPQGK